MLFWSEAIFLTAFSTLQTFVCEWMAERKYFAELLHVEALSLPMYYISVRNEYLLHGECVQRDPHNMQYRTYKKLSHNSVKDAVPFGYD